eukprot:1966967-Prymnesium_polylepis.1
MDLGQIDSRCEWGLALFSTAVSQSLTRIREFLGGEPGGMWGGGGGPEGRFLPLGRFDLASMAVGNLCALPPHQGGWFTPRARVAQRAYQYHQLIRPKERLQCSAFSYSERTIHAKPSTV